MPLTPAQMEDIVFERGIAVMQETYTERAEVWRSFIPSQFVQAPSPENLIDYPFGGRFVGTVGLGTMQRRRDSQRRHQEVTIQGQQRQVALGNYAFGTIVSRETQKVRNFDTVLTGRVIDAARAGPQAATRLRNDIIGGLLQKGTLSAGSLAYFDNSYETVADPNAGFIYDGKPFFAASGNAHTFAAHTATGSQGVNLLLPGGLSTATLQAATVAMTTTNAIDERGQKIAGDIVTPARLLVGPSMKQTAMAVAGSTNLPGGANNDINAYNGFVEPVIWNELTDDTDAWWLLAADPGIRVFDSGMPVISSYINPDTGDLHIGIDMYFAAYVNDWRGAISNDKAVS